MDREFYVDGSSHGNPRVGGFGVVELVDGIPLIYAEYFEDVTNNQMELRAILHVIKLAKDAPQDNFTVYSDSAYAINSVMVWMDNWSRNGWLNSKKKPVENLDIMKEIYSYMEFPLPNFKLVKVDGHSGIFGNELADAAATGDQKKIAKLMGI